MMVVAWVGGSARGLMSEWELSVQMSLLMLVVAAGPGLLVGPRIVVVSGVADLAGTQPEVEIVVGGVVVVVTRAWE